MIGRPVGLHGLAGEKADDEVRPDLVVLGGGENDSGTAFDASDTGEAHDDHCTGLDLH
jgi:hypothetical protein